MLEFDGGPEEPDDVNFAGSHQQSQFMVQMSLQSGSLNAPVQENGKVNITEGTGASFYLGAEEIGQKNGRIGLGEGEKYFPEIVQFHCFTIA